MTACCSSQRLSMRHPALDWCSPAVTADCSPTACPGTAANTRPCISDVLSGVELADTIERTRACCCRGTRRHGLLLHALPAAAVSRPVRRPYTPRLPAPPRRRPGSDAPVFGAGRPMEDWPRSPVPDGRWLVVTISKGWSRSEVYFRTCHRDRLSGCHLVEGVRRCTAVVARADRFYVHNRMRGAPATAFSRSRPTAQRDC